MKKVITLIGLSLLWSPTVWADTALTIPALYSCLGDFGNLVTISNPPALVGNFNLTGVSGQGSIQSQVPSYWDEFIPPADNEQKLYTYTYTIDLSGMSPPATSHCVKLLIHFGGTAGCNGPGVEGDPGQIQSATLNPWGDISFVFNSGCLGPGQSAISFSMISEAACKTNYVTVIDDYVNPASGLTNEVKINVPAIVPDIPPDPPPWVAYIPRPTFQGVLFQFDPTNAVPKLPATNGNYDFTLHLVALGTNGPAVSAMTTQTVSVVNGLFTIPLPGEPVAMGDGSVRYLNLGVRPSGGSGAFTQLNPSLPITPAPQAFYAYTAGSVTDLAPGQAVTSLNGLSDAVNLQAGSGIILETNGNTLTLSAQPGVVSDRSLKTDFAPIKPADILARLAALPIEGWRYTNDIPGIRHVGPMAQDFRATFGLGHGDKLIEFVDEEGVALAAIQGLNQKLEDRSQSSEVRIQQLEAKNAELQTNNASLEKRLEVLEHIILKQNQIKGAQP